MIRIDKNLAPWEKQESRVQIPTALESLQMQPRDSTKLVKRIYAGPLFAPENNTYAWTKAEDLFPACAGTCEQNYYMPVFFNEFPEGSRIDSISLNAAQVNTNAVCASGTEPRVSVNIRWIDKINATGVTSNFLESTSTATAYVEDSATVLSLGFSEADTLISASRAYILTAQLCRNAGDGASDTRLHWVSVSVLLPG